ncbi:4-hydroxy-tetrahydrodipicolinate synthase [Periweissella beninensis]|uniref:4-hydroxy-tetrahydrodipicolinate synthase n=1 Tax=Periweissella beninensis TaxID=504936 RepID=A0ABT0VFC6_9LACO|nr:4-hydroxy-tetrahydrodipicolinate synthase [Periweissella beninensis]MBM7543503.1 4-hydroxy-tetrahydrodipicolinate synthase [Periweissella beninensis]MCM2436485.1 4-hydroxy-tetrahydrodipicolinate synthase [Periweissella beninensis]MCT4396203.1 4-hydroxy-tetrahydrodipicolinate synthase [Periweissella beninensis]
MTNLKNASIITAIVTPFDDEGLINYQALDKLINHLLLHGSQGFVVGGTTGEAPTLSESEKLELYRRFAEIVAGRVPVIAGIGSNNTATTIDFGEKVSSIPGIDGALVVVPYYNKPNQKGMIAHFTAVAEQIELPVIIYNIPGRTGTTMTNQTVLTLATHPNIMGVKQCTTIDDLAYLVEHAPSNFAVYTGEDAQALVAKTIGARGVISVASHIYGDEIYQMYQALATGNITKAGTLQRFLTPRMNALFMYPSPAPVKALLNEQGFETGSVRLPILPLNTVELAQLHQVLAGDN